MLKSKYLAVAGAVVLAALAGWMLLLRDAGISDPGDPQQVARGKQVYAGYCAACHGLQLEGQTEDWKSPNADGTYPAPPHNEDGHTWHHPDKLLFDYTKFGGQALYDAASGYKSAMPAFGDKLSDGDIRDVMAYIKSTWSERAQEFQRSKTANDE